VKWVFEKVLALGELGADLARRVSQVLEQGWEEGHASQLC
jgi:hypothetical protein